MAESKLTTYSVGQQIDPATQKVSRIELRLDWDGTFGSTTYFGRSTALALAARLIVAASSVDPIDVEALVAAAERALEEGPADA